MELLQLKKFYPVYKAGDKLCVGVVGTNQFVECDYSIATNVSVIRNLLEHGYTVEMLQQIPLLNELSQKDMLQPLAIMPKSRSELFFQYLNIPFLTSDTLDSQILILGAGAAGATLAFLLAQFGFTNLFIVDNTTLAN